MLHLQTELASTLISASAGISSVYMQQLLDVLEPDIPDIKNTAAAHLIDIDRLKSDIRYRVPIYKALRLHETINKQLDDPLFAIKTVFKLRLKSFPIMGYAMMASDTLELAIQRLARYEPLVWDAGQIELKKGPVKSLLVWSARHEVPALAVEMALAGWINIGQKLLQFKKASYTLYFQHSCPSTPEQYQSMFGCEVVHGAEKNAVEFPSEWLDITLADGDSQLTDVMDAKAQSLLDNYDTEINLENRIRSHIFKSLPHHTPELEEIAQKVGESPRHLRYLLTEQSLNFRTLVDDVRKETALYFIRSGKHSLNEIAGFCGFAEQSSFNRAFKRWTGLVPSRYK